ncbi:MAG: hypothetical protein GXX83_00030 [Gaiellales bacterium]|nr:hypothetical protein [Gaiellales bacterium]
MAAVDKPTSIETSYESIPAELQALAQWVVWRYEWRKGKWTKVPYQAARPRVEASSTDPATWGTFEQALAAVAEADGIGFVFSPDDPYTGVDLDALTPETEWAIRKLDSYTEKSVSGRGAHVIVKSALKEGKGRRKGDFEIYSQSRYFAMTGVPLDGRLHRIAPRQAEVDAVMGRLLGEDKPDAPRLPPTPIDASDQWILERMFSAKNGRNVSALWMGYTDGYTSHSDADAALCCHLAFWTGRDPERIDRLFRQSNLYREKWERASYRDPTIDGAIRLTKEVYTPASERPSGVVAEVEGGTSDVCPRKTGPFSCSSPPQICATT